jgi:2,4-dienoyl-CoA reductase-like NADH-dependent reductase (Old Yellow Enzyme family)/thioredoxin reductase
MFDKQVPAEYRRLFEPLEINGVHLANRIVNTTHHVAVSEEREIRYLVERARGGAGLIGLFGSEGVSNYALGQGVETRQPDWDENPLSPVTPDGIGFYDDLIIPRLERRARALHAEGAKCFSQVQHMGAAPHMFGMHGMRPPIGPSAISDPYDALVPHPMTPTEIEDVIAAFAHSVRRVRDSGTDIAEIHAAHGYLLAQFLSPHFNRRTDEWGGSVANRARFLIESIKASRELVGDSYPIGVRIGLDGDGASRGLSRDDLVEVSTLIAPLVDYISVSNGSYSGYGGAPETAYVSPWYREAAHAADTAAAVKAVVDVPVLVTGRISDPSVAERLLADGTADMVGMVRALIADPQLPNKMRRGEADRARMCIGLSECHHIGAFRTPVLCAVNASAGREDSMAMQEASVAKTIVVVGAGPAGLEAARVAAERGHTVFLSDRERVLGGTPRILAGDPNRRNLLDHSVYFEKELAELGVTLMLGNEVSAEELVEFEPDVVIVATGGTPLIPDVPGIDGPDVVTALDVLRGEATLRTNVLVVAGNDPDLAAPTLAEHAADLGHQVTLISEHIDFARNTEDATRIMILDRLQSKNVNIELAHRLCGVDNASATIENTFTGDRQTLEDTSIVLACGLVPDDRLAVELTGKVGEVHVIGDALAPRRIAHATFEGARIARRI